MAPAARKQMDRLPAPMQVRVRLAIRSLASDPRPRGAAILQGTGPDRVWRIRLGDYRVLYTIADDILVVLVISVGHRREIYRGRRISDEDAAYGSPTDQPYPHGGKSWTREMLYSDPQGLTS
jgi:mRNA interferase RelE/StbE